MATEESAQAAYAVVRTKQFEKDLKRLEHSGRYDLRKLHEVIELLAAGKELPPKHRNHSLHGALAGREECHIGGDWLLVYRRRKDILVLHLLRTGTHAELFGE